MIIQVRTYNTKTLLVTKCIVSVPMHGALTLSIQDNFKNTTNTETNPCYATSASYTVIIVYPGMCLGLEEWWLHKGFLNLQNLSMLKLCLEFLVDIMFCVKWLSTLHSCWYFSIGQWVCSGGCFILVIVGADHYQPLWEHSWPQILIHNTTTYIDLYAILLGNLNHIFFLIKLLLCF